MGVRIGLGPVICVTRCSSGCKIIVRGRDAVETGMSLPEVMDTNRAGCGRKEEESTEGKTKARWLGRRDFSKRYFSSTQPNL